MREVQVLYLYNGQRITDMVKPMPGCTMLPISPLTVAPWLPQFIVVVVVVVENF